MREPGLDGRHRDKSGQIHKKRSDTHVDTLRGIYGDDLLPGVRGDTHLGTVLTRAGTESLDELLKQQHRHKRNRE